MSAITVDNLQKVYYQNSIFDRRGLRALAGVSFEVRKGEIFGLLGPNGAGKTTFIKILLGIARKTGGHAEVFSEPAGSLAARRRIGYLPEQLRIPKHHTGVSALKYYGGLSSANSQTIKTRGWELLEMVGLADRAQDYVSEYSKGMVQRLGLAQALLHSPDLLVLDEPTDGLDPRVRSQIRQLLLQLKQQGVTVFLNSHILQEVELVCDRVAVLDRGNLKFVGEVKRLTDQVAAARSEATQTLEATMLLEGDPEVIRAWSAEVNGGLEPVAESRFLIAVQVPDQASIDGCVDEIRRRGLSLISLARKQVTLEDAFLSMLDEG